MPGNIDFKFKTQELLGKYRDAASRGIRVIGARVAEEIIDNITIQDRVDTGAMRASTFFEAGFGSTGRFGRISTIDDARAKAKIPGKKSGNTFDFEDASEEYRPKGLLEVKVGVSASYAIYQEQGGRVEGIDPNGNAVGYFRQGGKFAAKAYDTVKSQANDIVKAELAKVK